MTEHDPFAGTPAPYRTPINFKARKAELTQKNERAMKQLLIACSVSFLFIILQLTGGILSHSIAIFTDTAHLASDIMGFGVSIFSLRTAQKPATKGLTYGYHRAEVIGTLVSLTFLWVMTIWLVYEAIQRVLDPPKVIGFWMLLTAVGGLFFNIIQMKILHEDDGSYDLGQNDSKKDDGDTKSIAQSLTPMVPRMTPGSVRRHSVKQRRSSKKLEVYQTPKQTQIREALNEGTDDGSDLEKKEQRNINIESASLHVLGDLLMSCGVVIAAIIIYFKPEWHLADPLCTFFFSIIICFTSFPVIADCIHVLMEGTPEDIDIEQVYEDIMLIDGVDEVHDLHLWSISIGKLSLTVHIKSDTPMKSLKAVTEMIRRKHGVLHTTVQVEGFNDQTHGFECDNDLHEQ
jgi:zinc transporter 2